MRDHMSAVNPFFYVLSTEQSRSGKGSDQELLTIPVRKLKYYEYVPDQLQKMVWRTDVHHTNIPNSKLRWSGADSHSIHAICTSAPWRMVKWIAEADNCFSHHISTYPHTYLLLDEGSWQATLISGWWCWNMQFS